MGQAKARGTYEERKTAAIKRNAELRKKEHLAELEREQNMTPREKSDREKARDLLCLMSGLFIYRKL
jgi:hypothetical protein